MTYADQVRENYQLLRRTGFTPEEARKMRGKSQDVIDRAVREKQGLPEPEPQQTGNQVQEGVIKPMNKGNLAKRLTPEESVLIGAIRAIGLQPGTILAILEEKMEKHVEIWKKAREDKMALTAERQLETLRGYLQK